KKINIIGSIGFICCWHVFLFLASEQECMSALLCLIGIFRAAIGARTCLSVSPIYRMQGPRARKTRKEKAADFQPC
ncbi:MAG: hypothetical protein D3916_01525, partial [Candidatus Electrothrix sp. MAN1_4]|nr:hypothetical protein [Candidatus Electrothrix sp. MAN1_4]